MPPASDGRLAPVKALPRMRRSSCSSRPGGTRERHRQQDPRLQAPVAGLRHLDADEVLGFEADQRRFDFAAVMLQGLGVSKVRIMTNNPEKIAALAKAGLDVISDHRVLGRPRRRMSATLPPSVTGPGITSTSMACWPAPTRIERPCR